MTTVVCNRTSMAADRRGTGGPMFVTSKIFRVRDSIYGFCGNFEQGMKFINWRKNPDQQTPTFSSAMVTNILELNPKGIFIWQEELVPVEIELDFYSIGSGAMTA